MEALAFYSDFYFSMKIFVSCLNSGRRDLPISESRVRRSKFTD